MATLNITIDASDETPNAMDQDIYSYTTESEPGPANISITGTGPHKIKSNGGPFKIKKIK